MAPAPTYRRAFETDDVEIEQYNELDNSNQDRASIKQASRIANKKAENNKRSARELYKTEKHRNNLTNPVLLKLAKQAGTEGDLEFMFKMMKTVDSKLNGAYQPKKPKIYTSLRISRRSKSLDLVGDQYCNEIGDQLKELKINYDEEKKKKKQYRDESDLIFEMFYNPTEESQRKVKELMAAEKEQKASRKAEKHKHRQQTEEMFDMFYNPSPETRKVVKEMLRSEKEEKKKKKAESKDKNVKQEAEDVFDMFYNPTPESREKIKQMIKEQKEEKARAKAEKRAAQGGKNRRLSLFSSFKSEVSRGTRALDLAVSTKRPSAPARATTFPTLSTTSDFKPHISHTTKRNVYRGTNAQTSNTHDFSPLISHDYEEDDLDLYGAPIVEPVSYLGRNAPMATPVSSSSNPFE